MTETQKAKKTDSAMIEKLALALPLHEGETILWYRETDYGYELRVLTADGFEGMHDIYGGKL